MPPPKQFEAIAHFAVTGEHDEAVKAIAEQNYAAVGSIYRMLSEKGLKAWQREQKRALARRVSE